MFKIIKSIIQAIKELKEIDEVECYTDSMCPLSQEELKRIGSESFEKYDKQRRT